MTSHSKKKILWVGDSTATNSGYANYSREILSRLHKTGKYNIVELACFGTINSVINSQYPWKIYSNLFKNAEEEQVYNQAKVNSFGHFKFHDVVLEEKPDIVIDVRDWWMFAFEELSPLRKFYNWLIMPPIDSIPQPPQFLSSFRRADRVLSYSNWGKQELEKCGIDVSGVPSPAINYDIFKPIDQTQCRNYLGIDSEDIIILSVMRNQKRKQYPDLIQAFSKLLDSNLPNNIKKRLKLYMHCQYPDAGWDMPKLLLNNKCVKNVLFTYKCEVCKKVYTDFFNDAKAYCKRCGKYAAVMPGSSFGVTETELSAIYNASNVYAQYSSCEGFGMPMLEAAACGLKTYGVAYSATKEVIENCGGTTIKPRTLYHDDAELLRSLPDNDDFISKISLDLINYHILDKQKQYFASLARSNYDYDKSCKIWEQAIDSTISKDWNAPPEIKEPLLADPNLNDNDFIKQSIIFTADRPDLINSYWEQDMMQSLAIGAITQERDSLLNDMSFMTDNKNRNKFDKEAFQKICLQFKQQKNELEKIRCGIQ